MDDCGICHFLSFPVCTTGGAGNEHVAKRGSISESFVWIYSGGDDISSSKCSIGLALMDGVVLVSSAVCLVE